MLLAILVAAVLLSCVPAAGGTCKREGNIECSEDAHILVCEEGQWVDKGQRVDDMYGIDGMCECEVIADDDPFFYCATNS